MKDYLLKKRKLDFIITVTKWKNLPKVWKAKFEDGADMRLWFNKILNLESYSEYVNEVINILENYHVKILTDQEKEEEFLNAIKKYNKIPERGSLYFSDNNDMYTWYMNYRQNNGEYVKKIHSNIKLYNEFDLEPVWDDVKYEFVNIIKKLKKVPEYGEAIISSHNLDVRAIYEQIETYDKPLYDQVWIHLETYKNKSFSFENRIQEMKDKVSLLGYIPSFQESRFDDGIDMFTWYTKYKNNIPNIGYSIDSQVKREYPNKNEHVHIYTIPNFKKTIDSFGTIIINAGERLDLTDVISYETSKPQNDNATESASDKSKSNETISFIDIKKGITDNEDNCDE